MIWIVLELLEIINHHIINPSTFTIHADLDVIWFQFLYATMYLSRNLIVIFCIKNDSELKQFLGYLPNF